MKLKEYLKSAGISHQSFASQLAVSQPTVTRWANGIAFPDPIFLDAIEKKTDGQVTPRDMVDLWVVDNG